jgi:hypothetical protein
MTRFVVAALVSVAAFLPSAFASGAFLHVTPSTVARGRAVVFTGSVAQGCARGDQVTLISRLFPGHAFGGEGAVTTRVGSHGRFSRRFTVGRTTARGTYVVTARCGGGNLGVEAKLRVRA